MGIPMRSLAILMLVLICCLCTGCVFSKDSRDLSGQPTAGYQRYQDDEFNFTIEYPDGWVASKVDASQSGTADIFHAGSFFFQPRNWPSSVSNHESIWIILFPTGIQEIDEKSVDSSIAWQIESMDSDIDNTSTIESSRDELAGHPALKVVRRDNTNGIVTDMRTTTCNYTQIRFLYATTNETYTTHLPLIEHMMDSIRIGIRTR